MALHGYACKEVVEVGCRADHVNDVFPRFPQAKQLVDLGTVVSIR